MKGASDLGPLLSASSRPDPGHTMQGTGDGPDIGGGEMMCTYSALPRFFADFPFGEVYEPPPRTPTASSYDEVSSAELPRTVASRVRDVRCVLRARRGAFRDRQAG